MIDLNRRSILKGAMAALALPGVSQVCAKADAVSSNVNLILTENSKPVDAHTVLGWAAIGNATNNFSYFARSGEVEAYARCSSVQRGGSVDICVSTRVPSTESLFTVWVYRLGWYGGAGSRLVYSSGPLPLISQPSPTNSAMASNGYLVQCNWSVSHSFNTGSLAANPSDMDYWTSGLYVILVRAETSQKYTFIPLIVRDDGQVADYLFQYPIATMQAYNDWGGYSLYTAPAGNPIGVAQKVSFDRPYAVTTPGATASGVRDVPRAGDFFSFAYNAVLFLEREGFNVTYCDNLDIHSNASLLNNRKCFMSVGHDEYWSNVMRQNVTAARDNGVNLVFMGGNEVYWRVRFEDELGGRPRTMVCYKLQDDPDAQSIADQTCEFSRDNNNPESLLVGMRYFGPTTAGPNESITVQNTGHWVYDFSGLHDGDKLPGLLGYEPDMIDPSNSPSGLIKLATSTYATTDPNVPQQIGNMTIYSVPSGASVFATGSMQFTWGLDEFASWQTGTPSPVNLAAQQMMRNVLNKFAGRPTAPPNNNQLLSVVMSLLLDD